MASHPPLLELGPWLGTQAQGHLLGQSASPSGKSFRSWLVQFFWRVLPLT